MFAAGGPKVTHSFATVGHRVVSARVHNCIDAATGATNVWVVATKPRCDAKLKRFDLMWRRLDPNGLPLNPEWRWQCDYPGFSPKNSATGAFPPGAIYPDAFPDPAQTCNQFRFGTNGKLNVGSSCSTQIQGVDVPTDPLWYTICHYMPNPPFQDSNEIVHGHVNWRDVTYTGTITVEHIQPDFPYGDGDVDLNMTPTNDGVYQPLTTTMPGVTLGADGNTRPIHLEFKYDEAIQAFPDSAQRVGNTWSAALASLAPGQNPPPLTGVVVGLFGLDARHGSYSEVHPVYGLALQEASGPGFSRWLLLARNGGNEGACSGQTFHWLTTPSNRITLQLPLPTGQPNQLPSQRSYYSANFTTPVPDVRITFAGGVANVTVPLPTPPTYGVLAGELQLQTTVVPGARLSPLRLRGQAPPPLPFTVPGTLEEPEQLLASLAQLLPPNQRSALNVPIAPRQRRAMSAVEACNHLRSDAMSTQPSAQTALQVQLVQEICNAAGQP